MAKLHKRGPYWWYDFRFRKHRYQGTTFLKNKEKAESFVAKLRTDLALGLVGLSHRDPVPTLKAFLQGDFLVNVRQNAKADNTRMTYERAVRRLTEYPPFATLRLDKVNDLAIQGYVTFRKSAAVATINSELAALRKALLLAEGSDLIRYRTIHTLPGERRRDFIVDTELEIRYLDLADYPLKQVAILMLDLGLRPEEAVALRKGDVSPESVTVKVGKTVNARRALPQTDRTREAIELCSSLFPDSPWVFPGYKGKHLRRARIDALHFELREQHHLPKDFALYSCRHTFGTRLAQSGANPFELKAAMGHGSVKESERYVHPTADTIGLAFKRKEMLDRMLRGEDVTTEITTVKKR